MKAKRLSKDMISNLPTPILENILCLIPFKEAIRTSILSTSWRYNWTYIPKLVFNEKYMFDISDDDNMFDESAEDETLMSWSEKQPTNYMKLLAPDDEILVSLPEKRPTNMKRLARKCKVLNAIHQFLSLHRTPIFEFTLSMEADEECVEIDQIITYLVENNALKKFTLKLSCNFRYAPYRLPLSIFSLHQLTDLYLSVCDIDFDPTFSGFGGLTSLYLDDVNFTRRTLLHLLSNCPLLKCVSLILEWENVIGFSGLDLTIIMLLECFPSSIEHLTICVGIVEFFVHDVFPRELPTTLIHLKNIWVREMTFAFGYETPFLFLLIKSSPNLEKLKLQIDRVTDSDPEPVTLDKYSDIWLEHLIELEIKDFPCLKNELEFVKFILAKSPVLKTVKIFVDGKVTDDEEMELLITLLSSPRQSRMIEFDVE